jgi:hypothetical protein
VAVSPDESTLTVIANRRRDVSCATSIGDDGDADLQPRPLAEEAEKSGGSLTPALLCNEQMKSPDQQEFNC